MSLKEIDEKKELTEKLPVLREAIGLTQEDMANIIGINSQRYKKIEEKKCSMDNDIFHLLMTFFRCNRKTGKLVKKKE